MSSSSSSHSSRPLETDSANEHEMKRIRKEKYEYIDFEQAAALLRKSEGEHGKTVPQAQDKINCYGIVVSYTRPKELHNKASKYMASYFMVDPTKPYTSTTTAVCLNVFANEISQLPVVYSAGDILRCHRVKANFWNGLQLVGTIHGDKAGVKSSMRGSSFVTFHSKFDPTTGLLPIDTEDIERVEVHSFKDGSAIPRRASSAKAEEILGQHYFDVQSTSAEFSWDESELGLVRTYRSWAASMLMNQRLQDAITPTFSLQKLQQLLRQQQAHENSHAGGTVVVPNSCDIIGVFVGTVTSREASTVLLWDGTTLGSLAVHGGNTVNDALSSSHDAHVTVSREAIQAVEASIFSSCVYHTCIELCDVETLRPRITAFERTPDASVQILPGAPLALEVVDPAATKWLSTVVPGTWLRFRALRLAPGIPASMTAPARAPHPRVVADTHIVVLPPYAVDPTRISTEFKQKVHQSIQKISTQLTSGETEAPTSMPPPAPVAPRSDKTKAGEELTNIALLQATPAPAKFCVRGSIVSYWPNDISKFTVDATWFHDQVMAATGNLSGKSGGAPKTTAGQHKKLAPDTETERESEASIGSEAPSAMELLYAGRTEPPRREFMFTVRLADDSGEIDVFLSGRDAEVFLGGTTATKFNENVSLLSDEAGELRQSPAKETEPRIVDHVQDRLRACIQNKTILQFYIRSYSDIISTSVGLIGAPNSKSKVPALPVEYRRFAAFNTNLFQ